MMNFFRGRPAVFFTNACAVAGALENIDAAAAPAAADLLWPRSNRVSDR
jgi:hypothetical protein